MRAFLIVFCIAVFVWVLVSGIYLFVRIEA